MGGHKPRPPMDDIAQQVAAARDLLVDGVSRKAVVETLVADFGLSPATAYRRVGDAADSIEPDGEMTDLAEEALGTMVRLMRSAEAIGDEEVAMARAEALAGAVAKLKILRIRV